MHQDRDTNLAIKSTSRLHKLAYLRLKYLIRLDLDEQAPTLQAQQHEPSARDNELGVSRPVAKEKLNEF